MRQVPWVETRKMKLGPPPAESTRDGTSQAGPALGPQHSVGRWARREPVCHLPAMYVTPQRPQVISSSRTIIGKNYSLHLQMRQQRAKGEEMTCSKLHLP